MLPENLDFNIRWVVICYWYSNCITVGHSTYIVLELEKVGVGVIWSKYYMEGHGGKGAINFW